MLAALLLALPFAMPYPKAWLKGTALAGCAAGLWDTQRGVQGMRAGKQGPGRVCCFVAAPRSAGSGG